VGDKITTPKALCYSFASWATRSRHQTGVASSDPTMITEVELSTPVGGALTMSNLFSPLALMRGSDLTNSPTTAIKLWIYSVHPDHQSLNCCINNIVTVIAELSINDQGNGGDKSCSDSGRLHLLLVWQMKNAVRTWLINHLVCEQSDCGENTGRCTAETIIAINHVH
jgi:hypothetical protein